jgi:antitoxin YefM
MIVTYRLNTSELGSGFIDSLRGAYPDQDIKIIVCEQDETEYLASSPANKKHLDKAIKNITQGKNLVSFETLEQAIQCVEERTSASVC